MNHDPRKAIRQAMMIARREVTAPNKASIKGQKHILAYITPYEAELLMRRGGSGRLTEYGVPAFDDGDGGGGGGDSDGGAGGDAANSEASTQDAAGGNAGEGAGPTGAGAGATGETGPDDTDASVSGNPAAVSSPTAPTATAPFGTQGFGQAPSALGMGMIGTIGGLATGVPGLGAIGTAIGTGLDVEGLNSQLGMMGLPENISYEQALAHNMSLGMFGKSATDQFGQTLGYDALAEAPMSAFSAPQGLPDAPADTSGAEPYYAGVKAPKQPGMQADEEAQRALLAARNPMQQPLMYADGGAATGGRMDPRMLPGIHVRVPHERVGRADGGPVQQPQDEDVRIDDPIMGYHSSPHEFDRFDPSKVGTGEGNQMFGHGLYFAENPQVSGQGGDYWRQFFNKMKSGPERSAAGALFANKFDAEKAIDSLTREVKYNEDRGIPGRYFLDADVEEGHRLLAEEANQALDMLRQKKTVGPRTYEVAIHARPEEFMNWDKPLSQQNPRIREFFKQRGFDRDITSPRGYTQIAGDVYFDAAIKSSGEQWRTFARPDDVKKLSEDMLAAGIPGIKYLDAGSRDAGEGTRNYVVFHPKHLEIKRRYADGGEITPPRDLGADPTVQQALRLSSRVTDKRTPQLQDAADLVAAGRMTPEEYHALVGQYKPVQPYTNVPPMASEADLFRGLSEDKHGKVGAEKNIPEGHPVGLRLDIPAYDRHGVWAPTIHDGHGDKAKAIAHAPFAHVSDPVFSVSENKALNVARGTAKSPFAKINGFWKPTSPEDAQAMAQEYLYHPEWRQVGMDPERHSFFYDRETRQPIVSAEEALQVGPLVLAKNPQYGKVTDYKYADGGGIDDPTVQQALSYTRKVNPMGLYSHAADVAANLPQQKGTPQQMLSMLTARGVKPDEINNSGAQDTFGNQKTVAKQDLVAHFQQNMPDIQEQKRIPKPSWERLEASNHDPEIYAAAAFPAKFFEWTMAYMEDKNPEDIDYREVLLHSKPHWNENSINDWVKTQAYNKAADFGAISSADDWNNLSEDEKNKFITDAKQRLNYLKTTLDFANRNERSVLLDQDKNYFSSHWSVPNVIGHIRMHDRDNGDTLHVEELQSDWGQAKRNGEDVPEHPLINNTNTWTDLLLKRVLREAVRGGYKRIAWTPGQEQAERYDLSQHLDSVHYNPGSQTLYATDKNGREVLNVDAEPHEIHKHIGKELAQKILENTPDLHSTMDEHDIERDEETGKWNIFLYGDPVHDYDGELLEFNSKGQAKDHLRGMVEDSLQNHTSTLKNVDLVVGGEGMRSYYDKIVPARIAEVTKKLGAPVKVEPHKINTQDGEKTLHSIQVTPELRDAVKRGMPVYKDGGTVGYANGGMPGDDPTVQRALNVTREYQDPPTKHIDDWAWKSLSDVQNRLGNFREIPSHVQAFGSYMDEIAKRAANEGLSARDLIKAYTITRASIQRRANDVDRVRAAGLDLPKSFTGKIRPEGAFGEWLHTRAGQDYLNSAERGEVNEDAIANAVKIMTPFGKHEKDIPDALRWAANNLPGKEQEISTLVANAMRGASEPAEWRAMAKDVRGVGPSKAGFLASLMGRGDQPTLDARQIIEHTGRPTSEAQAYLRRKGGEGATEAVERLSARQQAMDLQLPEELRPYYQHLAHHAVWDKAADEVTTHEDVMNAMRGAAHGGEIDEVSILSHPVVHALRLAGLPKLGEPPREGLRGGGSPDDDVVRQALQRVATPFSEDPEVVQQALRIASSLKVPQGAEFGTGSFYSVKQPMAVADVSTQIEPLPGVELAAKNPLSWEGFYKQGKGGTILNVGGDRSNLGRLTHINNKELAWPVDLHAGPKYMMEPNPGAVWANNPAHATALRKKILEAAEKGPVYGVYAPMGAQAVDSSHNMFDAVMAQVPNAGISKKDAKEFDDAIMNGLHVKGNDPKNVALRKNAKKELEGWPGILNAKEASEYARNMPGGHRSAIVKFMDSKKWRDMNFPAIGITRVAITDPELKAAAGNMLGHRIVEFDPQKIAEETKFQHSTYTSPTSGRYVGDVPLVQRHYAMPDVVERLLQKPTVSGQVVHPYSMDPLGRSTARKLFEEQKQLQPINERMINTIGEGLERQKEYGLKKGGTVVDQALRMTAPDRPMVALADLFQRQLRGRPPS